LGVGQLDWLIEEKEELGKKSALSRRIKGCFAELASGVGGRGRK